MHMQLAMYSAMSDDEKLMQEARDVLRTFDMHQVAAHGIFSASYLTAMDVVRSGPIRVDIYQIPRVEAQQSELWKAARSVFDSRIVIVPHDQMRDSEEYAVVCGGNSCSDKMIEPLALLTAISEARSSQI